MGASQVQQVVIAISRRKRTTDVDKGFVFITAVLQYAKNFGKSSKEKDNKKSIAVLVEQDIGSGKRGLTTRLNHGKALFHKYKMSGSYLGFGNEQIGESDRATLAYSTRTQAQVNSDWVSLAQPAIYDGRKKETWVRSSMVSEINKKRWSSETRCARKPSPSPRMNSSRRPIQQLGSEQKIASSVKLWSQLPVNTVDARCEAIPLKKDESNDDEVRARVLKEYNFILPFLRGNARRQISTPKSVPTPSKQPVKSPTCTPSTDVNVPSEELKEPSQLSPPSMMPTLAQMAPTARMPPPFSKSQPFLSSKSPPSPKSQTSPKIQSPPSIELPSFSKPPPFPRNDIQTLPVISQKQSPTNTVENQGRSIDPMFGEGETISSTYQHIHVREMSLTRICSPSLTEGSGESNHSIFEVPLGGTKVRSKSAVRTPSNLRSVSSNESIITKVVRNSNSVMSINKTFKRQPVTNSTARAGLCSASPQSERNTLRKRDSARRISPSGLPKTAHIKGTQSKKNCAEIQPGTHEKYTSVEILKKTDFSSTGITLNNDSFQENKLCEQVSPQIITKTSPQPKSVKGHEEVFNSLKCFSENQFNNKACVSDWGINEQSRMTSITEVKEVRSFEKTVQSKGDESVSTADRALRSPKRSPPSFSEIYRKTLNSPPTVDFVNCKTKKKDCSQTKKRLDLCTKKTCEFSTANFRRVNSKSPTPQVQSSYGKSPKSILKKSPQRKNSCEQPKIQKQQSPKKTSPQQKGILNQSEKQKPKIQKKSEDTKIARSKRVISKKSDSMLPPGAVIVGEKTRGSSKLREISQSPLPRAKRLGENLRIRSRGRSTSPKRNGNSNKLIPTSSPSSKPRQTTSLQTDSDRSNCPGSTTEIKTSSFSIRRWTSQLTRSPFMASSLITSTKESISRAFRSPLTVDNNISCSNQSPDPIMQNKKNRVNKKAQPSGTGSVSGFRAISSEKKRKPSVGKQKQINKRRSSLSPTRLNQAQKMQNDGQSSILPTKLKLTQKKQNQDQASISPTNPKQPSKSLNHDQASVLPMEPKQPQNNSNKDCSGYPPTKQKQSQKKSDEGLNSQISLEKTNKTTGKDKVLSTKKLKKKSVNTSAQSQSLSDPVDVFKKKLSGCQSIEQSKTKQAENNLSRQVVGSEKHQKRKNKLNKKVSDKSEEYKGDPKTKLADVKDANLQQIQENNCIVQGNIANIEGENKFSLRKSSLDGVVQTLKTGAQSEPETMSAFRFGLGHANTDTPTSKQEVSAEADSTSKDLQNNTPKNAADFSHTQKPQTPFGLSGNAGLFPMSMFGSSANFEVMSFQGVANDETRDAVPNDNMFQGKHFNTYRS